MNWSKGINRQEHFQAFICFSVLHFTCHVISIFLEFHLHWACLSSALCSEFWCLKPGNKTFSTTADPIHYNTIVPTYQTCGLECSLHWMHIIYFLICSIIYFLMIFLSWIWHKALCSMHQYICDRRNYALWTSINYYNILILIVNNNCE